MNIRKPEIKRVSISMCHLNYEIRLSKTHAQKKKNLKIRKTGVMSQGNGKKSSGIRLSV